MYVQELFDQVPVYLTKEETELLQLFKFSAKIYKKQLEERQVHVMNDLVKKNVLERKKDMKRKRTYYVERKSPSKTI